MVLVALKWLHMRVWVDRAPWANVVVALGVLGVEDFKDGAGGVFRWSWTDVPGLAGVDGAIEGVRWASVRAAAPASAKWRRFMDICFPPAALIADMQV